MGSPIYTTTVVNVRTNDSTSGKGVSNTERLESGFPRGAQAFLEAELANVRQYYYRLYRNNMMKLNNAELPGTDMGNTANGGWSPSLGETYFLRYLGGPLFTGVETGAAGLPGTPWLPNTVSTPGVDPSNMPAPPATLSEMPRNSYGQGNPTEIQPGVESGNQSVNVGNLSSPPEPPVREMGKSPYIGPGAFRGNG